MIQLLIAASALMRWQKFSNDTDSTDRDTPLPVYAHATLGCTASQKHVEIPSLVSRLSKYCTLAFVLLGSWFLSPNLSRYGQATEVSDIQLLLETSSTLVQSCSNVTMLYAGIITKSILLNNTPSVVALKHGTCILGCNAFHLPNLHFASQAGTKQHRRQDT